ncbi:four helix bundle protein [Candidatus Peregrinibacteria bacterium CG10_big_fil_rev_8_21_14_0_10_49_10]|nr:MAG: four helix bundle protein [Candidatus Peregrinibacteria bacterium CG10_big_fil_rev_8_21_14_0_10_49_10]
MHVIAFEETPVWQKGMQLLKIVYSVSRQFPEFEIYALTSQIRRASISILANAAEGYGRFTDNDKASKYIIARGECTEVHALLLMAVGLNYVQHKDLQKAIHLCNEVGRMLSGLIRHYKKKI